MASIQITIRVDESLPQRADKLVDYLSTLSPVPSTFTRADVLRTALVRGLEEMEIESESYAAKKKRPR